VGPLSGRLVLVEGFPGTGKSTTAQWIARSLQDAGRPARWIYEEERPHPVCGDYDFRRLRTMAAFETEYVGRWRALVEWLATTDYTVVVESAFLQWPIITLLRANDPADEIFDAIVHSADVVAPLALLIYTPMDDVRRGWQAVGERRGVSWQIGHMARAEASPYAKARGLAGPMALERYWEEHVALCDRAVAHMPLPTVVLDPAAAWSARRGVVVTALGLSGPAVTTARDLSPYVGVYVARGASREVRIELEADGLVLTGALWPRNALLPVGPDAFDVQSWPFTVRFERQGEDVIGFTTAGPPLPWTRFDGGYDRAR
jgi:hypothetical protein